MAKKTEAEVKTSKSTGASILPHNCSNDYQDRKYGSGRRVWNHGIQKVRCTVCGEEKRT